jgi:hypothetical protein
MVGFCWLNDSADEVDPAVAVAVIMPHELILVEHTVIVAEPEEAFPYRYTVELDIVDWITAESELLDIV